MHERPDAHTADTAVRRRVLIVDDEALIRWALGETLAEQGFAVEEAASRKEALDLVEGGTLFDVVLLDLRLPDSHDLQLLARLRTLMPGTPVILMTAYATPETVASALDLGAFRVVSKPFEIAEIAALVNRAH